MHNCGGSGIPVVVMNVLDGGGVPIDICKAVGSDGGNGGIIKFGGDGDEPINGMPCCCCGSII